MGKILVEVAKESVSIINEMRLELFKSRGSINELTSHEKLASGLTAGEKL